MPTVIDELIVRLSLDPKDFDKSQKAAAAAFLKTRDAAKATAKDTEDAYKKAADSIDRTTRSALTLFGVLLGTKSLTGFIADVTAADASVGRFAQNLGDTPQRVQAWELAVQQIGGAAADADAALAGANKQLNDFRLNGTLSTPLLRLQNMSGVQLNVHGSTEDYIASIADAAHKAALKDRNTTAYLLDQSGFGGAFGNVLMNQGGPGLNGFLNSQAVQSPETIKRMEELQQKWAKLQQTVTQFAATLWGDLQPALGPILDDFQHLADDLVKAEPALKTFGDEAGNIAKSLGGWRIALEGLVALWAGGKLAGMLGALGGLLTGGGAAAGGAAAGGLAGPLAWAAILGVDAYNNTVKQTGGAGDDASQFNAAAASKGYKPGYIYDPASDSYYPPGGSPRATAPAASSGAASGSRAGRISQLRSIAMSAGLDPDKFVQLAMGEGFNQYVGDEGSSFGDFQLHMGGISASMPGGGLGDEFRRDTGMDPRDPSTSAAQDQWVANYIRQNGASQWTTARQRGITNLLAARASSAGARGGSTTTVNIGAVNVQTNGRDAPGIAKDIMPALRRAATAAPLNTGPA